MKFFRDQRGNVALLVAISSAAVFLCGGAAVDYGNAVRVETKLKGVADTAVLSGVQSAVEKLRKNPMSTTWKDAAVAESNRVFKANLNLINFPVQAVSKINFEQVNGKISGSITYDADIATQFLRVVGYNSVNISGSASASGGLAYFSRVNFVIDNSNSMGVGATMADQALLANKTGCALACHYNDVYGDPDTLAAARSTGATLRIDMAKAASINVVKSLKDRFGSGQKIEFGIYTASNSLTTIETGTTDFDKAIAEIESVDLAGTAGQGGTNIDYSLKQLVASAPAGGTGGSTSDRISYTVLITDGIELNSEMFSSGSYFDYKDDANFVQQSNSITDGFGVTVQPLAATSCQVLKDKKHTVMAFSLEHVTEFLGYVPSGYQQRMKFVDDTRKDAAQYLSECATKPEYLYTASSPDEALKVSEGIYAVISNSALRLTQ